MKLATPATVLVSVLVVPAAAAIDEAAIQACRTLVDDNERLACYDREVGPAQRSAPPVEREAAARATPSDAPAPAETSAPPETPAPAQASAAAQDPAPAETTAPLTAEERFGRERAIANAERERDVQAARDLGELSATVTSIEKRIDGLMTITLDNGQVWRQNRPDSMFRLKVGDPVKIQPAALSSYLMSGPSKRSTRVTRIE